MCVCVTVSTVISGSTNMVIGGKGKRKVTGQDKEEEIEVED